MVESKKLSISGIKKNLKNYEKDAIISMLIDCYKISNEVQNYISVQLNPDAAIEELFKKAKFKIEYEFFPKRGFGKLRLSQAKKAITDFKNLSNDEVKVIDLMIYYVEMGVNFTVAHGDIDEPFYNSMESMYSNVLRKTSGNTMLTQLFRDRLEQIVIDTSGVGWGFHDNLTELFDDYVGFVEEN